MPLKKVVWENTEAGIKYILQNGFNIGYYMRQSSAVFELDNNENEIPNTEKYKNGEEFSMD